MTVTSVGIIGAGGIVAKMHLPTLLAMSGTSVSWVIDRDQRRLRDIELGFGVPTHATQDLASLPGVDVMLVAIPFGARPAYYKQAAASGSRLYVEKPLARTLADHDALLATFPELGLGLQLRGSVAAQTAKRLVADGALGDLETIEVEHGFPGQLTGSAYSSDLTLAGGGMLFEVGIHWLDLALYVAGGRSAHVRSGRMIVEDGFDLDTEAVLSVETIGGEVDLAVLVSGLRMTSNCIRIHGSSATLTIHSPGSLTLGGRGTPVDRAVPLQLPSSPAEPFQLCAAAWTDFLAAPGSMPESWTRASASRCTTEVIELLYGLAS